MSMTRCAARRAGSVLVTLCVGSAARANAEVGSPDTATADPPVARPATKPCVVTLFEDVVFADFSNKTFAYAPPAACPGPWAKVVFQADFSVTAGRQFDRTANVWIGGTNVYFGTTAEPSRNVSPSWHVERDLTDYAVLLTTPQPGEADLGNLVNDTFTGIITGSASIQFYPLARHEAAPRTADVVLPLADRPTGGTATLPDANSLLARTFDLPTNVERAVLDVYAQSQAGDEFWYTCVPDELSAELESCGGTAFRETEVTIDGEPAGVAPVYPWIFTGGIDPLLWRPIVGVQALEFVPYRVDLTPFAALLSDGRPHEIAVGVFNARDHFSVTASLLLYLDRGSEQVGGDVVLNTLADAPSPTVANDITTAADGTISGTVTATSSRSFVIAGFAETSHGRVRSQVVQTIQFANRQDFDITATRFVQDIHQQTTIASLATSDGPGVHTLATEARRWPLDVDIDFAVNADGTFTQATTIRQADELLSLATRAARLPLVKLLSNVVATSDTAQISAAGAITGSTGQESSQRYFTADSDGQCYSREIDAAAGVVTAITDGQGCPRAP